MFKCSWEVLFFDSEDTEFFKADRNNKKQIDNHTLMHDMLQSNMSVVCTYHCILVSLKSYFYFNIHNIVSFNIECFKNCFPFSSIPSTISRAKLTL